jgi:hypothetical protein
MATRQCHFLFYITGLQDAHVPTAYLRHQPQGRRVWFDEARKLSGCPECAARPKAPWDFRPAEASSRANVMLVSTCLVVPSATPGPGASVKRSSSSMRPKGCVASSPLSFDKSASLEPAKTGLVAQSAPANQGAPCKIEDRLGRVQTRTRLKIGFVTASQLTSSWRGFLPAPARHRPWCLRLRATASQSTPTARRAEDGRWPSLAAGGRRWRYFPLINQMVGGR